jgi:hypothetical protein
MTINMLLSTIILVSFLVTVLMAVGSYVAYKLREGRRPLVDGARPGGEPVFFERIDADAP